MLPVEKVTQYSYPRPPCSQAAAFTSVTIFQVESFHLTIFQLEKFLFHITGFDLHLALFPLKPLVDKSINQSGGQSRSHTLLVCITVG